jgi:molybdopterin converting factor small subunit
VRAHAALAPYAASMSCARNFEYARLSTKVEDGDEIAFLPPVSGG